MPNLIVPDITTFSKTILPSIVEPKNVISSPGFKLNLLAESIHSEQTNTTRFLIISKNGEQVEQADKASLKLILKHEQGSLLKALQILDRYGLDMTKIQSLPIVDEPWKYSFFIDVTFKELPVFVEAMKALEEVSEAHKILGIYKNKNHETRQ